MAATVEAQFKYSYQYEGKTISFLKGEQFSLIKKVNGDWWQVKRKHDNGTFESIYVPANYMKETQDEQAQSHTYQNMSDLQAEYAKAKESLKNQQLQNSAPPPAPSVVRVSPKLSRMKSLDRVLDSKHTNGGGGVVLTTPPSRSGTEPEYAIPHSPKIVKRGSEGEDAIKPILKEWQPGYSLPQQLKPRSSTVGGDIESTLDMGSRRPPGAPPTPSPAPNQGDNQRHNFQSMLNTQLSGGRLLPPGGPGPAPKPKPKHTSLPRPKSSYIEDVVPSNPSTFGAAILGMGSRLATPTGDNRRSYKKPAVIAEVGVAVIYNVFTSCDDMLVFWAMACTDVYLSFFWSCK